MFVEIDTMRINYVDCLNLKQFLIKWSYLPNDNLLLAIIRRMDLDGVAKLNFMEFIDALRPLENYYSRLEKARAKLRRNSAAKIAPSPIN